MFKWILPIFSFSLIAPPIPETAVNASEVERPRDKAPVCYEKKEACDIPVNWGGGPATSLHHKESHAHYYWDEQDKAWKIKRSRPFGNVTYGTWWY